MRYIPSNDVVFVGPNKHCNYITDGDDDAVQVNEALKEVGDKGTVVVCDDIYVAPGNHIKMHCNDFVGSRSKDLAPYYTTSINPCYVNHPIGPTLTGPTSNPMSARIHLAGTAAGKLIDVNGYGICISNLTLDGNRIDADWATIEQAGSHGIDIHMGMGLKLHNLNIFNCGDAGIYKTATWDIYGVGGPSLCSGSWNTLNLSRCNRGIDFPNDGGDIMINGIYISDCLRECIRLNFYAGFFKVATGHFSSGGNGGNNEARRTQLFWDVANTLVNISGIGGNQFTNIDFESCNWYNLYLFKHTGWGQSACNTITNCHFYQPWNPSLAGECIAVFSDNNVISGNVFLSYIYSQQVTNVVHVYSGATNNVIVGNSGIGTHYSNAGTGTVWQHNS